MKDNIKQKKVLIVDDEPTLGEILAAKLDEAGFETILARDGNEGLEMALAQKPDLILLDIVMPKMDGITMLRELRQNEWGKTAAVIMLSNLNTAEAVERSLAEGVYDYLVKVDYSLDDLAAIVKKKLAVV